MSKCKDCRHFGNPLTHTYYDAESQPTEVETGFHVCDFIKHESYFSTAAGPTPQSNAFVIDGSGYYAALIIAEDFGCINFAKRESSKGRESDGETKDGTLTGIVGKLREPSTLALQAADLIEQLQEQDKVHWKTRRTLLSKLNRYRQLLTEVMRIMDRYETATLASEGVAWQARGGETNQDYARDVEAIEDIREALKDE